MSDPMERCLPAAAVGFALALAAATLAVVLGEPAPAPTPPPAPRVRLVVLVVFDQLRGDLIDKWRGEFGGGGFRRLQDDGAWFTDCHYPYAATATGPGHAAMLTGAPPADTGIINNEWYDRQAASEAYCAGDLKHAVVPAPPKYTTPPAPAAKRKPKPVGTPARLLAPTVADVLKEATGGRGKVFGLSLKDRSGILPSGKKPDGVFWFDGRFVTSTYYADAVPRWVADFNASGKADAYFGREWVRFRPDLDYDRLAGPDKGEGEGSGAGQGFEFPHPTTGGKDKEGKPFADVKAAGAKYYEAVAASPFGNELLLAFAKECIDREQLGADAVPDLLTVSFSSNDLIGHTWGPDSHEVLDCTLRSDAVLADLLGHLDAKVGVGNYAVVLTADHGICPLPEFAARHPAVYPEAKAARRVPTGPLLAGAEKHLSETFGRPEPATDADPKAAAPKPARWVEAVSPPYLYLNHKVVKAQGQTPEAVAAELADWLRTREGVGQAYPFAALAAGEVDAKDEIGQRVKRSFHPERSGDVYVVLNPYHLFGETANTKVPTGTTHGAPHAYDTHVPLLVYGPGVPGGKRGEKVTPLHAAAVAAHFLGVPPPEKAAYPLPSTLGR